MFAQNLVDFLLGQGLSEVARDGQTLHLGHIIGVKRGSKHNDDYRRRLDNGPLRISLQKLKAVHTRHFHVQQNQRRAGGRAGLRTVGMQLVEGLLPINRYQDGIGNGQALQQGLIEVVRGFVVIDEEDTGKSSHGGKLVKAAGIRPSWAH